MTAPVPGPTEVAPHDDKIAYTGDAMFEGYLDPVQAGPLHTETARRSFVQALAKRIPMGPTGVEFKDWSATIDASWVGEGQRKPVNKGSFTDTNLVIKPHKVAVIFVESAEVVRSNPRNYLGVMRNKVAQKFAEKFDDALLKGTNTPFGAFVNQSTKRVSLTHDVPTATNGGLYTVFNNALAALVNDVDANGDHYKLRTWLLDETVEPLLNGALDNTGRPLFNDGELPLDVNAVTRQGRILGRPALLTEDVTNGSVVGYAGDWSKVVWGPVGGISYDVSDQATLVINDEIVSLWQHNLVAVRCEAEYGAMVLDPEAFVKLENVDVTP